MIKNIIDNWLNEVEKDLRTNFKKLGLKASGNWEKELNTYQETKGGKIIAVVEGSDYTYFLENGRKPTKTSKKGNPTLREIIRKWIDNKKT